MEAEMEFVRSIEQKKIHKQLHSKLLASQEEMKNNQPSTSGAATVVVNGTIPATVAQTEITSAESVPMTNVTSQGGEINLTLNPAEQ
jgi:hypothetical protein